LYKSETSKFRNTLAPFCDGYGIDIGFGGDKIVPTAIGVDLEYPYACTGIDEVQLGCDARKLHYFNNEVLDYVYSSHTLEDFSNTVKVLKEWFRVIKKGGRLILVLPNEEKYQEYSAKMSEGTNEHHSVNMSFEYLQECVKKTGVKNKLIYHSGIVKDYNFGVVYTKI
jgi:predicted SAM-dependent methyltransferase